MRRVGWLDGLRGVAAMQVVMLHYASTFIPAVGLLRPELVRHAWEKRFIYTPLFLPFDGFTSVYVFFILSGVALTYSFGARPLSIGPAVVRRTIRLGMPMAGSLLFAAAMIGLLPWAHIAAASLTGSEQWLGVAVPAQLVGAKVAHQIALEGMLAGYDGLSFLPRTAVAWLRLVPLQESYNSPLWTLHTEFCGSLLVLALVAARALTGPRWHWVTCAAVTACFAASTMVLFVVGHVAAGYLGRIAARRPPFIWAALPLAAGIVLSTTKFVVLSNALLRVLPPPLIGPTVGSYNLISMIGAVLIFAGVALSPALQRGLERPATRWLGKISFSLYLTHFPFLVTAVAAFFLLLTAFMPLDLAMIVASIAGVGASFLIAALFERWVDRPAIALSRMVGARPRAAMATTPGAAGSGRG